MATKMIFICSCGTVFDIDDSEGMEAHVDANTSHTVSESYIYRLKASLDESGSIL